MKKKLYFFLILSALLATSTLSAQDATTGLKLHYTFDDGTAIDASGNNLTGTFMGSAASVAGKLGNAVGLAAQADYVLLPNDVVSTLTDYSVTAWVNVKSFNNWARIFDIGSGQATSMFLTLNNGWEGRYVIKMSDAVGEQIIAFPIQATNTWLHVAVTCKFTDGIGVGIVYINGDSIAAKTDMTTTPADLGSTTQNYIGKSQYNDPTINGSVDDFRIYSRALTPGDIMTVSGLDKVATLDTIIITDAVFDVPFASGTFIYNVQLPVGTASIVPEIRLSASGSIVTGDGAVDVSSGSGVATIVVTSIDGTVTKTYTLNYTVLNKSNDTKLSDLQVSVGVLEPAFSMTVYKYLVNLPISTTSIAVLATANDVLSTVAGDGDIALDQDGGQASVTVTAEDGSTKVYTIVFIKGDCTALILNPSFEEGMNNGWTWVGTDPAGWRGTTGDGDKTADGKNTVGIWNSPIADLEVYQTIYGLESGYYQVTALYTVSNNRLSNQRVFANDKSTLFGVSTQPAYSEANLAILGATETYTFGGYPLSTAENGPFLKLAVVEHVTADTLRIGVKLSGMANTLGYTFPYTTQGDLGFSKWDKFTLTNIGKKASLDNILVTDGAFDVPFASGTYSYTVSLAKGTVTVDPEIKLSFNGTPVTGDGAVDVSSGSGTSTIVITSLDGTAQRTYTINYVVRTISNDARLSALSFNVGTLVPSFSSDVYSYKVVVPQHTPSITVSATAKDNGSTFTGTGVITLDNSNGIDSIIVTAQDGTVKKYMIKFERDNATFFKVTTAPTIDGIISADEPYASDQWNAQSATIGTTTTGASSKFQIVHDDTYIYVAVQTIDTTVHVESTIGNEYERDCIEFYFSMDPAMTSNGVGVTSFRIQRDGLVITGGGFANLDSMILAGLQFGVVSDANGYVVEAKILKDSLVKTANFDGVHFKFEAKTADNTTGAAGGRTYQMAWKDNSDSQWQGPNTFAAAVLSPNAVVAVAIKNVLNNASSVYLDKATKTLYVASAANQVQIYDLRGSLVRSVTLNGKTSVNVSNLQRGVYIVKCGKDVSKIVL